MSPRPHQQHFPPPVIPSRSSSLGSLPPGASPPNPTSVAPIPRSSSPFSVASHPSSIQHPTRSQRSDRDSSRKKSPAPQSVATLHILKALEPSLQDSQSLHHQDFSSEDHTQGETVRLVDKDKKKSFWGVLGEKAKDKEKLKDRERTRDRDKQDDDVASAELTKMIGTCHYFSLHSGQAKLTRASRLSHRNCFRGLEHRTRSLRKSICKRIQR